MVAQLNCFLGDVGCLFEREVTVLETPLEFPSGPIGLDGSKTWHDDFSFCCFSARRLLRGLCPPVLIILRANRAAAWIL